jgi:hypothetical protein
MQIDKSAALGPSGKCRVCTTEQGHEAYGGCCRRCRDFEQQMDEAQAVAGSQFPVFAGLAETLRIDVCDMARQDLGLGRPADEVLYGMIRQIERIGRKIETAAQRLEKEGNR